MTGSGPTSGWPRCCRVFEERRERLRGLIAECPHAAAESHDLILVADLRMKQRRKLWMAGVLTVSDLATAATGPSDRLKATFAKLRPQAALQWLQMQSDGAVTFELVDEAAKILALLPAPIARWRVLRLRGAASTTRATLTLWVWRTCGSDEHR